MNTELDEKANKYYQEAIKYMEDRQFELAIIDFCKFLEISPNVAVALKHRGHCYMELRQKEEETCDEKNAKYHNPLFEYLALTDFNKSIELCDSDGDTYFERGCYYCYITSDYKLAIKDLQKAIELGKNGHSTLAFCYEILEQYDLAIKSYDEAIQTYPDIEDYYEQRGFCYYELNQYYKAIKDLKKVCKSNNIDVINKLGKCYYFTQQYDLAIKTFNKTEKNDECYVEDVYYRGLSYFEIGNLDKAVEDLEWICEESTENEYKNKLDEIKSQRDTIKAEAFYESAKEALNKESLEGAIGLINNAIKLVPSNKIYIELKQKIEWKYKEFQKIKDAQEYYDVGMKYFTDAQFKKAIEFLIEAVKLQPNNDDYKKALDKAKAGKIDIMTCSKQAILTLGCFDNSKAEKFLLARDKGEKWYGCEEFAEAFNLQPHTWIELESKLSFPLRQANKYARRVDW